VTATDDSSTRSVMEQHRNAPSPRRTRRARLAGAAALASAVVALPFATTAAAAAPTAASDAASAATGGAGTTNVAYVEVNNHDLASVGRYEYADGSPVYDLAIIFAANIDWDGTEAVLSLNDRVQATLDAADEQIRPLQAKGIDVSLSILGNHQGAGIANFGSPEEAADFAAQVADVVERYGLDGVDLDDEYSEYGVNGTAQPNDDSAGWLITALRTELPDAVLSFYDIGPASDSLATQDPAVNAQLDLAWNPYYGSWRVPAIPGLTKQQLSPAAVDVQATSTSTTQALAERTVREGYGVFLTYNLPDDDRSAFVSTFTRVLSGQDAYWR